MSEFINTIDVLGEQASEDAYLTEGFSEFQDLRLTSVRREYSLGAMPMMTKAAIPLVRGSETQQSIFRGNQMLETVDISSLEACLYNIFDGCASLRMARLPSVNRMGASAFKNCTSLTALVLSNQHIVCRLVDSTGFVNTPIANGTGFIYVPRRLKESYETATNWSVYAGQFRVLQDYTVDGSVNGELDESKI